MIKIRNKHNWHEWNREEEKKREKTKQRTNENNNQPNNANEPAQIYTKWDKERRQYEQMPFTFALLWSTIGVRVRIYGVVLPRQHTTANLFHSIWLPMLTCVVYLLSYDGRRCYVLIWTIADPILLVCKIAIWIFPFFAQNDNYQLCVSFLSFPLLTIRFSVYVVVQLDAMVGSHGCPMRR